MFFSDRFNAYYPKWITADFLPHEEDKAREERFLKNHIIETRKIFTIGKNNISADEFTSCLAEIENLFKETIVAIPTLGISEYIYFYHNQLVYYFGLDYLFKNSEEYTLDKATKIFQSHFEALQKKGFDVNGSEDGRYNIYTPLGLALDKTMPSLVRALINLGADVNCYLKQSDGTVLQHCLPNIVTWPAENSQYENQRMCIDLLLKNGCDPNSEKAMDLLGKTPALTSAVIHRKEPWIQLLVASKADIDITTSEDEIEAITPLFFAATMSKISTVKLLVDLGANLFLLNSKMQSVVDVVKQKENIENATYLNQAQILFIEKVFSCLIDSMKVKAVINIVVEYLIYPLKFDSVSKQVSLVKTTSVDEST